MMTPRQAVTLSFVAAYQAAHDGASPSFEEIANGTELASKGSVARAIVALEKRGLIRRLPRHARSIEILKAGELPPDAPPYIAAAERWLQQHGFRIVRAVR